MELVHDELGIPGLHDRAPLRLDAWADQDRDDETYSRSS